MKINPTSPPHHIAAFALVFVSLVGSILFIELSLRLKGHTPNTLSPPQITVSPGGTFYQIHPTLGFIHIPGAFTVSYNNGVSWQATHLPNSLRITKPLALYTQEEELADIWIFGDSITYGFSVNDDQTYPWLLQERFPQYEVVNFAISGYGTTHSLIQLKEALTTRKPPALVILAYGAYQDDRNTFSPTRRMLLSLHNKLGIIAHPYARFNDKGALVFGMEKVIYHPYPFEELSVAISYVSTRLREIENKKLKSHDVSKALINEFVNMSSDRSIPFILAGFDNDAPTQEVIKDLETRKIPAVDISVSLTDPTYRSPFDSHPNAAAHRMYADKLTYYLLGSGFKNTSDGGRLNIVRP